MERPKVTIEIKDNEPADETEKPKESTPDFVEPVPKYDKTEPAKQSMPQVNVTSHVKTKLLLLKAVEF